MKKKIGLDLQDVKWCAEQCEHQQSGEMSVYHMVFALDEIRFISKLKLDHILKLAQIIDSRNVGFRTTQVHFADYSLGLNPEFIERQVKLLLLADLTPEKFYWEFEKIHPFEDGNSRLGALLYNKLNGTLRHPINPPEFRK